MLILLQRPQTKAFDPASPGERWTTGQAEESLIAISVSGKFIVNVKKMLRYLFGVDASVNDCKRAAHIGEASSGDVVGKFYREDKALWFLTTEDTVGGYNTRT